jgi:hypothetical protein
MTRLALVIAGVVFLGCVRRPPPVELPKMRVERADLEVVDARATSNAPWGHFEDVFSGDLKNLVAASLPASLVPFDGALRLTLREFIWTWHTGPFFLAQLSGKARVQLERKPRSGTSWCSGVEGAAVHASEVATGSSLDEARAVLLESLHLAFVQLEQRTNQSPCPDGPRGPEPVGP